MPQSETINIGTWPALDRLKNEPNLKLRSLKFKPSAKKSLSMDPETGVTDAVRFTDFSGTFTLDADIKARTALGTYGIGATVSAGLTNFDGAWRGHNSDEGVLYVDSADDDMSHDADVPVTTTLVIEHRPFVVVA
jgi:hypothetical protein